MSSETYQETMQNDLGLSDLQMTLMRWSVTTGVVMISTCLTVSSLALTVYVLRHGF